MANSLDRRVVPEPVIALVQACQRRVPCHLGGGTALSGAHLRHRLSGDVDLFCHQADEIRALVRELPRIAAEAAVEITIVLDAGTFVRAAVATPDGPLDLDLLYEPTPDVAPPPDAVDGIVLESLEDLRAAKLTCILSRSEPRDLVDLCFLDRAGYPPELDLHLALKKDAGIDPGVLAWLLGQFPVDPLPVMLVPFDSESLRAFRDDLRARFKLLALPR